MMKLFTILLCIAIGSVFGDLERRNFAEEKLEIAEDDNEASSLISLHDDDDDDRKTADNSDESLRVKYTKDNSLDQIAASAKDAGSVEQKTSRNPSPVIETSTVKPSSSKATKNNSEIIYSWKPAKYFKTLRKITKPEAIRSEIKTKTLSELLESSFRDLDAHSRRPTETNLVDKARTVLRRKRDAIADAAIAKYPPTTVEDPPNMIESLKAYRKLRDTLPRSLRLQIRNTDALEEKLLKYLNKNPNTIAPEELYRSYERSIIKERGLVSDLCKNKPMPEAEAWRIFNDYKALRKGNAQHIWNFIRLRPSLQGFLKDESTRGFRQYINIKFEENHLMEVFYALGPDSSGLDDEYPSLSQQNYNGLRDAGSSECTQAVANTDAAEEAMLNSCKETGAIPKDLVDAYYENRKKELKQLQLDMAATGLRKFRLLDNYVHMRKGSIWYWMTFKVPGVIEQDIPCRHEYEAIKKEELYTEKYLDGSLKIGEVPKDYKPPAANATEMASSQSKSEKTYRKILKAEVAELSRAEEEEEKVEEMKRGLRAKETETVAVEYDAHRGNVENVIATSDADAKGDVEAHGRLDNVTAADVTNKDTTKDTKTKDGSSYFLRFLILFAMIIQAIIAVLILAPLRDKLAEWCKRRKKTESGQAEKEPLQIGEKVFAVGPTSKSSKSPINAAQM